MADNKNSSIASQFSGLPMKALIGAPLKAATDANAMIAKSQTDFILEYCFENDGSDTDSRRPVMIPFRLERQTVDANSGKPLGTESMVFSVPLLTLVPINSLAIETLKVGFEMEVKSSREFQKESSQQREARKKSTDQSGDASASDSSETAYKPHEFDTELHGTLSARSTDQNQTSSHASYEVTLTAGQLPLPKGVTAILDIFTKNMTPVPVNSDDDKK